jgi:peptidyl-prolyl cis-trans isomerase SurA
MRLIAKRFILTFVLLGCALPALRDELHAEPLSNSGLLLDRIVALVDDGVVLQSELDQQMGMIVHQLREQGTRMPPAEILRQQVLEALVIQKVQLQRAERLGLRIGDEQLNLALQQVAQRNNLTLAQLPDALAADGMDYAVFREQLRRDMTIDALRQRDVLGRIAVSEREIQRWLEQQQSTRGARLDYDISQILIPLPEDPSAQQVAEARERADRVHSQLQEGEDFAELAVRESSGQQALSGGHLGWRRGSQLPQQFAGAIQALSAGEISLPVRSSSGFHIFRVNATRGGEDQAVVQLQTRARHILLMPDEIHDDEAVRTRLSLLRERIVAGESFSSIAMVESHDAGSAARGGDLGWNPPGAFVPEFEAVLDRLEPGELSEPFRSPFGWHLILLEDRQQRDTTEEVRRMQAVQAIRASKMEQETELWLRRLRDEAWVEIRGG